MLADESVERLTEAECRALLGATSVGRVAVTIGALPAIVPVTYGCVGGDVVFRIGEDERLRAALDESVVAFEVDCFDEAQASGWSVLAVGKARETHDPEVRPRAGEDGGMFVSLHPEFLSGRRLRGAIAAGIGG